MTQSRLRFVSYPFEQRFHCESPLFHANACYQLKAALEADPDTAASYDIDICTFEGIAFWERGPMAENNVHALSALLRGSPDILACSLYVWNVEAIHEIARVAKQVDPSVLIIAGGPEVYGREEFPDLFPCFDILIEGDGEVPLREVLTRLASGTDLDGIPNVSFRRDGQWVHNRRAAVTTDQNTIPNVYAMNQALIRGRGFYLSTRGCTNACDYCLWARQPLSEKAHERVVEQLETLMVGTELEQLTFFDYDLIEVYRREPKLFSAVRSARERARPDFELRFFVGPHNMFDPVLTELVEDLRLQRVILGLQSMRPEVQRAVNRPWAVLEGAPFERVPADKRDQFIIEMMFPLPGETPSGFLDSLRYLLGLGYYHLRIFDVMALRGTKLHRDRDRLGLKCLTRPPYFCVETPTVTFRDWLRVGSVNHIITLLSLALDTFAPKGVSLSPWFRRNPTFLDRVLKQVDAGTHPDEILRGILKDILDVDWQGGFCERQFNAVSTASVAPDERVVAPLAVGPAQSGAPPDVAAPRGDDKFRVFFRSLGIEVGEIRQSDGVVELELPSQKGTWSIRLATRRVDIPFYQTTRFYKIGYNGSAADLTTVQSFVDYIRSIEAEQA